MVGNFTREMQREVFRKYYQKYYKYLFERYGAYIDTYIRRSYGAIMGEAPGEKETSSSDVGPGMRVQENQGIRREYRMNSLSKLRRSISKEISGSGNHSSREFYRFLRDVIMRRTLIYELRNYLHKKIADKDRLMSCLRAKNDISRAYFMSSGKYGKVYRLDDHRCVKILNISEVEIYNLSTIQFSREIEISKLAGELGVGPKIHETYVCVNEEDSCCYGIIYMELLRGYTFHEWKKRGRGEEEKKRIRKLLDEKIEILHQNGVIHNDVHDENVFLIMNENDQVMDVKIIDYGFANYLSNYAFYRNRQWLDMDLFQGSRKYVYRTMADHILEKIA